MRCAVAVVWALGACHGSGGPAIGDASHDAPTAQDAPTDMRTIDAAELGPITVTVYGDGVDHQQANPVPGVDVYFVEPGDVVTKLITGMDGVAVAQVHNNTTVWVVHRDGSTGYFIETFEGAQVGDSLVSGNPTPLGPNTIVGTEYIARPSFGDATLYHMALSCTSGTQTSGNPISDGFVACAQQGAANAIVWATDSSGNLGYTTATGIDLDAHTSSGTALSMPAFQAGAMLGVTFTNLPSAMGESTAQMHVRYSMGTDPIALQEVEIDEGTLTDTMTRSTAIAPFGDQTHVYGQVTIAANAYEYNYDVTTAALLSSVTIDASTMVHPAKTWHYDSATNSITWTQDPFGVDPTILRSYVFLNNGQSLTWSLFAPYSGGPSLPTPTIPADLATLVPSPQDATSAQLDITSYVGKSYHDALVGHTAGAASWHTGILKR